MKNILYLPTIGNRDFGESCEADLQCNKSANVGYCGENRTCTCNIGLIRKQGNCYPGTTYFFRLNIFAYLQCGSALTILCKCKNCMINLNLMYTFNKYFYVQ